MDFNNRECFTGLRDWIGILFHCLRLLVKFDLGRNLVCEGECSVFCSGLFERVLGFSLYALYVFTHSIYLYDSIAQQTNMGKHNDPDMSRLEELRLQRELKEVLLGTSLTYFCAQRLV